MHLSDSPQELVLSATDLAGFLACRHLTALDMAVTLGDMPRPPIHDDPLLEVLQQRGMEHERRYVESLRADGRSVLDLDARGPITIEERLWETLHAMRTRADVIYQGALQAGKWYGRPDVMRRVPTPSAFGDWSYEIVDTKLARETRAATILQLGLYSEMLAIAQGAAPEYFFVVTPDIEKPVHQYRVHDYAAYFRLVRARMQETVVEDAGAVAAANYPEPVDHCDVCPWSSDCSRKRRADDHLSLVAGISRLQRRELEERGVS